jgi:hypothetical protein
VVSGRLPVVRKSDEMQAAIGKTDSKSGADADQNEKLITDN